MCHNRFLVQDLNKLRGSDSIKNRSDLKQLLQSCWQEDQGLVGAQQLLVPGPWTRPIGPHLSVCVLAWQMLCFLSYRHNVLWATFDGQLMSLWKKRTVSRCVIPCLSVSVSLSLYLLSSVCVPVCQHSDGCVCFVHQDQFSEVLFHVSSITNMKKQDKRRFSVYFRKKHYDFMAHNDGKNTAQNTITYLTLLQSTGLLYCTLLSPGPVSDSCCFLTLLDTKCMLRQSVKWISTDRWTRLWSLDSAETTFPFPLLSERVRDYEVHSSHTFLSWLCLQSHHQRILQKLENRKLTNWNYGMYSNF